MPFNNRKSRITITIEKTEGGHRLLVTSYAGTNPAGWRLQRGGFFPIDQFEFTDETAAFVAAKKLQAYLDTQI